MADRYFSDDWLDRIDRTGFKLSLWVRKITSSEVHCSLCKTDINISKGFEALMQHSDSKLHQKLCEKELTSIISKKSDAYSIPSTSRNIFNEEYSSVRADMLREKEIASTSKSSDFRSVSSPSTNISNEEYSSVKAELIWAMKVVCDDCPFKFCNGLSETFKAMFPDTRNFSLDSEKMSYFVTEALGPYFRDLMLKELQSAPFTLLIDDTVCYRNKKLLQVNCLYWSDRKGHVVCGHLETFLIGNKEPNVIYSKVKEAMLNAELAITNMLMLRLDIAPNVNNRLFKLLNSDSVAVNLRGLINLRMCPFYVIVDSFSDALDEFGRDGCQFINKVYNFFNRSTVRYEEYKQIQKEKNLPENEFLEWRDGDPKDLIAATKRIIEQWDGLKSYFLKYFPRRNDATASQSEITDYLRSTLGKAEISFLTSSAELFYGFLLKLETDKPVIHLVYTIIKTLVDSIIAKFCKPETVTYFESSKTILKDFSFRKQDYLPLDELGLSDETKRELANLRRDEKDRFLNGVHAHYMKSYLSIIKLMKSCDEKLLVALQCLQPSERKKENSCNFIETLCNYLPFQVKKDEVINEWQVLQCQDDEDFGEMRIDEYWNNLFHKVEQCSNVKKVITAVLTLSHGSADVHFRRWTPAEENMTEKMLRSILTIKMSLEEYQNRPELIQINDGMIARGLSACNTYKSHLEQKACQESSMNDRIKTNEAIFEETVRRTDKAVRDENLKEIKVAKLLKELKKLIDKESELEEAEEIINKRKLSATSSTFSKKSKR